MAKSFTKKLYNKTDVAGWLKQAEDDWRWAKASFREKEYKGACFVAHQVAAGEYTRELASEALKLALAVFRFAKKQNM